MTESALNNFATFTYVQTRAQILYYTPLHQEYSLSMSHFSSLEADKTFKVAMQRHNLSPLLDSCVEHLKPSEENAKLLFQSGTSASIGQSPTLPSVRLPSHAIRSRLPVVSKNFPDQEPGERAPIPIQTLRASMRSSIKWALRSSR